MSFILFGTITKSAETRAFLRYVLYGYTYSSDSNHIELFVYEKRKTEEARNTLNLEKDKGIYKFQKDIILSAADLYDFVGDDDTFQKMVLYNLQADPIRSANDKYVRHALKMFAQIQTNNGYLGGTFELNFFIDFWY